MKSVPLLAFTACMLLACSPQAEAEKPAAPARPALQRLVGTLSIVEDYAIHQPSGAPFVTRKTVLLGTVDQLVRVNDSMGTLNLRPEGKARLQMSGTVSETGHVSLDSPDSNSAIKTRGESSYNGKLGEVELSIARSKLGIGDEIHLRFNTPMAGKVVLDATHRNGMVSDLSEAGDFMGMSLLEQDPSDRSPVFKRDYGLYPKLGETPAAPFDKRLYDGIRQYPALFHLGVTTSPDRQAWTYAGTKVYSKPGSETQWTEKVQLSLKLVPR